MKPKFNMNQTQTILNYCLNRFCPIILVGFFILSAFSLTDWKLYALSGLIFFMDRFQFKIGYSVGYCDAKGIDPRNPPKSLED